MIGISYYYYYYSRSSSSKQYKYPPASSSSSSLLLLSLLPILPSLLVVSSLRMVSSSSLRRAILNISQCVRALLVSFLPPVARSVALPVALPVVGFSTSCFYASLLRIVPYSLIPQAFAIRKFTSFQFVTRSIKKEFFAGLNTFRKPSQRPFITKEEDEEEEDKQDRGSALTGANPPNERRYKRKKQKKDKENPLQLWHHPNLMC